MQGLSKKINGKEIIKETYLSFIPKAKIGIIGPNGAGKSTLLKIIAQIDKEFDGEFWIQEGTKVGYLAQEPKLDSKKNVLENVLDGVKEVKALLDEFHNVSEQFAHVSEDDEIHALLEKQTILQDQIDALDAWDLERMADIAMQALRCPPGDWSVDKLSGGEKRRVALCQLLLSKPDILLLDEPTNHLDSESVSWLENYLKTYQGMVITITHDRYFLDNVSEWILEMDRGSCVPWHCNYSNWLEKKKKKLELEEKEESSRQKELARELEWIRQSPKARQSKSKARIDNYQELLAKQKNRVTGAPQIIIPSGPRLGDLVIEAEHISKSFEGKELLKDFSFKVQPGSIVGIIGPNGAGKTTLFKMIAGLEKPTTGKINIGSTVKIGIIDQTREHLDDSKTLWEEISGGLDDIDVGNGTMKSRAYCAAFNFKGADQQKKIGQLSGGERNRVHMAKLLKSGSNVILLDEPSNDLDVDTLRALEDAILDFVGCVFVISHDRWFLDRIATHIIAFDTPGHATWFQGNYQDYCNHIGSNYDAREEKYKHKKLV